MATFVIVHGTGSGGWMWEPVVDRLRDAGHDAYAPTLVGVGDRADEGGPDTNLTTHVQQIVTLIEEQPAPHVVLVGHSYGGLVAEGVAAEIPDRIARLVPIDGMTVAKGESAMDAMTPSAAERMRVGAQRLGEGWKVPPNPVEAAGGIGAVEAGVSTADIERRFSERRGTHPIGTYDEAVTWAESQQVSRFYIMCTDKPPNASREWSLARTQELRDAGQAVRELPTGHYPMQSMPNALTELLVESALARPSAGA